MLMLMDAAGVHSATDQNERGKTAGAKYIHEDDHWGELGADGDPLATTAASGGEPVMPRRPAWCNTLPR